MKNQEHSIYQLIWVDILPSEYRDKVFAISPWLIHLFTHSINSGRLHFHRVDMKAPKIVRFKWDLNSFDSESLLFQGQTDISHWEISFLWKCVKIWLQEWETSRVSEGVLPFSFFCKTFKRFWSVSFCRLKNKVKSSQELV